MALQIKEEKLGNWNNVAELIDFRILKFAPQSLLGIGKADVMLLYKKKPGEKDKDQKRMTVFGSADAVFETVINKIRQKKNPQKSLSLEQKFKTAWSATEYEQKSIEPSTLLRHRLFDLGLNAKRFSELSGVPAGSVYHHTSGGREISRETAIEYAEKLGCDPVDLMFEKKSIPIWSKVNLLKSEHLEDIYNPGRLYSYTIAKETDVVDYAVMPDGYGKPLEKVVVPRDIYREDIKAIKIDARGSMYHNKVAFYYRASEKSGDYLNQLCVVGIDVITDFGDRVFRDAKDKETHYYFGLYEEVKGQANLINPDPYAKENSKNILTDIEPKFIAPIIAIVNPDAVVDQTKLQKAIPAAALVNKEEEFKMQLNQKHAEIGKLKQKLEETESTSNLVEQKNRKIADQSIKMAQQLGEAQRKAEEEVRILLNKVEETTAKINREMAQKKLFGGISNLFYKDREALDKIQKTLSPQTNVLRMTEAALKRGKK